MASPQQSMVQDIWQQRRFGCERFKPKGDAETRHLPAATDELG